MTDILHKGCLMNLTVARNRLSKATWPPWSEILDFSSRLSWITPAISKQFLQSLVNLVEDVCVHWETKNHGNWPSCLSSGNPFPSGMISSMVVSSAPVWSFLQLGLELFTVLPAKTRIVSELTDLSSILTLWRFHFEVIWQLSSLHFTWLMQ